MVFSCAGSGSVVVLRQRVNIMDTFVSLELVFHSRADLRGCQCGAADIVEPAHVRAVGIHVCHQKCYHLTVVQHVVKTIREHTHWVPRAEMRFRHYPVHTGHGCQ